MTGDGEEEMIQVESDSILRLANLLADHSR